MEKLNYHHKQETIISNDKQDKCETKGNKNKTWLNYSRRLWVWAVFSIQKQE